MAKFSVSLIENRITDVDLILDTPTSMTEDEFDEIIKELECEEFDISTVEEDFCNFFSRRGIEVSDVSREE